MNTFLAYLLEKDHRNKMEKFGIPEEVANYLHDFNDKYSLWFAKVFNTDHDFKSAPDKVQWVANKTSDMGDIMDWVKDPRSGNIQLNGYTWKSALSAVDELKTNPDRVMFLLKERNRILKEYPNGMYWVDLETQYSEEEKKLMGHCGNTTADTLYSLRSYDPTYNELTGYVTIAANPDYGWQQAKGVDNVVPDMEYHGKISDILIDNGMFRYENEFGNDFDDRSLTSYISSHRDEFDNPDELLSKIDATSVTIDDFNNRLDEESFDFIDVELYLDDGENLVHSKIDIDVLISFYDLNISSIDSDRLDNLYTEELSKLMGDKLEVTLETVVLWVNQNGSNRSISLTATVASSYDEIWELNNDGLENFGYYIESTFKSIDSNYDAEDMNALIRNFLTLNNVIKTDFSELSKYAFNARSDEDASDFISTEEKFEDDSDDGLVLELGALLIAEELPAFVKQDGIMQQLVGSASPLYGISGVDRLKSQFKSLDHPMYKIFGYFDTIMKPFGDHVMVEMNYNGEINIKMAYNSNKLDDKSDNDTNMDSSKAEIDYFNVNINDDFVDGIHLFIGNIINEAITVNFPMTVNDIKYEIIGNEYKYIKIFSGKGRILIHTMYVESQEELTNNINGIINRELKDRKFKTYKSSDPYNANQTEMTFESYIKMGMGV